MYGMPKDMRVAPLLQHVESPPGRVRQPIIGHGFKRLRKPFLPDDAPVITQCSDRGRGILFLTLVGGGMVGGGYVSLGLIASTLSHSRECHST